MLYTNSKQNNHFPINILPSTISTSYTFPIPNSKTHHTKPKNLIIRPPTDNYTISAPIGNIPIPKPITTQVLTQKLDILFYFFIIWHIPRIRVTSRQETPWVSQHTPPRFRTSRRFSFGDERGGAEVSVFARQPIGWPRDLGHAISGFLVLVILSRFFVGIFFVCVSD